METGTDTEGPAETETDGPIETETDQDGDVVMEDQETKENKKLRLELEKERQNHQDTKRKFEKITKTLHMENDMMKGRGIARGRGRGSRGRGGNDTENSGIGRGTIRGRNEGENSGVGRGTTGENNRGTGRKGQRPEEQKWEGVKNKDGICQTWLEQDEICQRRRKGTCRYEHPPLCQESCVDKNCKRIHYGTEAEAIVAECERIKEEVKVLVSKEKCKNLLQTGFCKYGSICKYLHPKGTKVEAGRKEEDPQDNKKEDIVRKEDKKGTQSQGKGKERKENPPPIRERKVETTRREERGEMHQQKNPQRGNERENREEGQRSQERPEKEKRSRRDEKGLGRNVTEDTDNESSGSYREAGTSARADERDKRRQREEEERRRREDRDRSPRENRYEESRREEYEGYERRAEGGGYRDTYEEYEMEGSYREEREEPGQRRLNERMERHHEDRRDHGQRNRYRETRNREPERDRRENRR